VLYSIFALVVFTLLISSQNGHLGYNTSPAISKALDDLWWPPSR